MYTGKTLERIINTIKGSTIIEGYFIYDDIIATSITYSDDTLVLMYENVIVKKISPVVLKNSDEMYLEELYRDVMTALKK